MLARDDDAILIEVVGNANNPWYASGDFLGSISDFRPCGEQAYVVRSPSGRALIRNRSRATEQQP